MNREILSRTLDPRPLSPRTATAIFDTLLAPTSTEVDRAALLVALASRDLAATELAEFAREMQRRAVAFPLPAGDRPIDLCGSGGARTPSFNVSTVSAFVVAAAGTPVVKHGNRSSRGLCGSSDLLEALGLPVVESLLFSRATYRRWRLAFLHAPLYHPAARAVAAARRAVGIPTLFNQLGPLTNPAKISYQLVGVPDLATAERAARVLGNLGRRRAMAVTSVEGCDEFSPQRHTIAVIWSRGRVSHKTVVASEFLPSEDRRGSWGALPPPATAEEARRILAGGGGARRGSVLLTAGAALWVAEAAPTVAEGVERARQALDSGRAEALLNDMVRMAPTYRSAGRG